ncbi:Tat pathway signal sequence domain protein [Brevundimonas sp. WCHBH090558]|uniref:Tat pathway signal sequence domain protein n=1 Tax=Brevundimonas huaxiensis TaxID=2725493 RepID=UPI00162564DE|nr:Tat pathway signal sequence domain protein [Brevundimonas huaxiensis]MBC1181258.1 Tat pathway signal sequence domain protein [Brevundimonas huaxiensis]
MRRVFTALAALSIAASVLPVAAEAQTSQRQRERSGQQQQASGEDAAPSRAPRIAPLRRRANAGPCPYVKILYDAARYVELEGGRAAVANVGYTGEIEGIASDCEYREANPIRVDMDVLFNLGRGPQAAGEQRTYRYWIAVTERNNAILSKEYFDLPVNFEGQRTASVTEKRTIVIPRAGIETSGSNFEILVGFDVTPEMAEFNRSGSRFRVNAGTTPAAPAPASAPSQ